MAHSTDLIYTEQERIDLTQLIIEDLVYRTGFISPKMMGDYIERIRDIWAPRA